MREPSVDSRSPPPVPAVSTPSPSTLVGTWSSGERLRSAVAATHLPGGSRLGHFVIKCELGRGGMAVVYLAHDEQLGRDVALKLLPQALALPDELRNRFRDEARAAAKIKHPNVAVVYSIQESGDALFFSMEHIEGETLAATIERGGTVEPARALEIARAVAAGLRAALSQGIIHRDVKPSNIMIDGEGRPRITDFVLARAGGAGLEVGRRGAVLGTPYYMAPEQGQGAASVDHRADMYSLGVTLFEMLCGDPPFEGTNPIDILLAHANHPVPPLPGVPGPADRVCRWLMEKDPARRPANYDALIAEIDAALRDLRTGGGARAVLTAADSATGHSDDALLRSQMILARTNMQMGRFEKAEKIYSAIVKHAGPVRIEAALRLGEVYEKLGDPVQAAVQWRRVIEESRHPGEVSYARWKLGNSIELQAAAVNGEAVRAYRAILDDPTSPFPRALLEARIRWLEESIAQLRREISGSSVRLE